ncbi:hypothetical protein [Paraferrimonas haliotis]|uniref:Uncharacterized protein n=1 Tax=Paraferrimonas haliotis TaxID=2013866 RepID=A0AA37WXP9_9GAMM|nr:hypothetical protein [Paraferrimonas haliotis]GLS84783.1 hypothetical protein GCM10007894_27600 [Paraferrimonas haliotis]
MKFVNALMLSTLVAFSNSITAAEHNHSHNHYNPKLEALGSDIIGFTVCYKNGHMSDSQQEVAFQNLVEHVGVTGQELGLYYMDKLGAKAEQIMSDEQGRQLWDESYCHELTTVYQNPQSLFERGGASVDEHNHSHHHHHDEVSEHDIEQGRLLAVE